MQKVQTLEQYQSLVKSAKSKKKAMITNCFLFPSAVQHYIKQNRFYYDELASGMMFYYDSEAYFLGYYFLNPELPVKIAAQAKPIVLQNLYNSSSKRENRQLDQRLQEAGFVLSDSMRQIKAEPATVLEKIAPICKRAQEKLEEEGFRFCILSREYLPQMWELLKETPEIPFYQIPYFSDEDLQQQIDSELIVGIVDQDGNLCTAHQSFLEGKTLYGWLAVRPEFKNYFGMGLMCTAYEMNYAIKNGYKVSGWIATNNKGSIRYHNRIGFENLDRYMDNWILTKSVSE